jgi:hypothetical protein
MATLKYYDEATSQWKTLIVGAKGEQGDVGPANTLAVGTVTDSAPGSEPEVTITGTAPNQTINFVLPTGEAGPQGEQGIQGIQGETGPEGPTPDLSDYVTLSGTQTLTNKKLLSSTLSGQTKEEFLLVSTPGFAGYTFDVLNDAVQYIASNSTANGTINFRGNSDTTINTFLAIGEVITATLLITNAGTAYYPTAFQIDGTAVTPKWQGGSAPASGNVNSINSYTFTIMKTATSTYTVLAAQTRFA